MVKHVFTLIDDIITTDTQVGERVEIVVPGTDVIIPDELAADITSAIDTATEAAIHSIHQASQSIDTAAGDAVDAINNVQAAAISAINQAGQGLNDITTAALTTISQAGTDLTDVTDVAVSTILSNSIPTYTITIEASNPVGIGNISFYLSDVAILRDVSATGITITSIVVNNGQVTLPATLTGNSNVTINGNITLASQSITLTLSPLPANRSIRVASPNITQYATYPVASGAWIPSLSRILFLGYTASNYGYIFDHNNSYISTNLFNISFYFSSLVHVPINNCIYIINGSSVVPYYITTNTYGSAITLSGTIYAQAYNSDDNVLYVGTSAGLYAINVITNQLIYSSTTYPLCTYLTYINVAGNKLLVVCRHTSTADNPIIINVATWTVVASYNWVSGNMLTAQPCYHAATMRLYIAMFNNTRNGIGNVRVIDLNPASPTYLQLIGTVNNVYARWALLVDNRLYTCSYISGSNSIVSIVSIPSHTVANVSMPTSGNVTFIYNPSSNTIYVCSINGVISIIPHSND